MKELDQNLQRPTESNPLPELVSDEILGSYEAKKLLLLSGMWGKVNAYGSATIDEFQIERENGEMHGIFKAWAHPVIPFLNKPELTDLSIICSEIKSEASGLDFEQNLEKIESANSQISQNASKVRETLDDWVKLSANKPDTFSDVLERTRVECLEIDRRLRQCFEEETLPIDPKQKLRRLTSRFTLALGLLSPFYDMEAILGDKKGFAWNPVTAAESEMNGKQVPGGELDMVGLFLPSIIADQVTADEQQWNGLDWSQVKNTTSNLLANNKEEAKLVLNLSETLNVPPHFIVFAANALEWSEGRPGGKKADYDKSTIPTEILEDKRVLDESNAEKLLRLGKNMNARIRFTNWMPSYEDDSNFSNEKNRKWNYTSISETADELLEFFKSEADIWQADFKEVFNENLAPQVENLDADSAKGRFFLDLMLDEKKLSEKFDFGGLDTEWMNATIEKLIEKRKEEYVRPLGKGVQARNIIGGKIFGLEELANHLPVEVNIPKGIVVNSEAMEDYLRTNGNLWNDIISLDTEKDTTSKIQSSQEIQKDIINLDFPKALRSQVDELLDQFPEQRFVVRSSSYDEDGRDGNTAAGIYESLLDATRDNLDIKIKECLSSFFSEKAIRFRELHNHSHYPNFAVLIQPYVEGVGGVVNSKEMHGDSEGVLIEVGKSADIVTSGGEILSTHRGSQDTGHLKEIERVTNEIKNIKGKDVDMEWVIDSSDKLWFLQLRNLPSPKREMVEKLPDFSIEITEDEDFAKIEETLSSTEGLASITILGERNLDAFQGSLFTAIATHGKRIAEIKTKSYVPLTSHFSNICSGLDIKLVNLSDRKTTSNL